MMPLDPRWLQMLALLFLLIPLAGCGPQKPEPPAAVVLKPEGPPLPSECKKAPAEMPKAAGPEDSTHWSIRVKHGWRDMSADYRVCQRWAQRVAAKG